MAGIFNGYDFSFFASVSNSITSFDNEKVGVDYTGYGYLGDMTTGLFTRIGFQVPYATVMTLLDGEEGPSEGAVSPGLPGDTPVDNAKKELNYRILYALGPSFRFMVSPTLSWYMGLGFKVDQGRNIVEDMVGKTSITDSFVGIDFDIGFRLQIMEHTALRIGVYAEQSLFKLTSTTFLNNLSDGVDDEKRMQEAEEKWPKYSFEQYIFTDPTQEVDYNDVVGYFALSYIYTSYNDEKVYRYRITGPDMKQGSLELVSSNNDLHETLK